MSQTDRAAKKTKTKSAKPFQGTTRSGGKQTKLLRQARQKLKNQSKRAHRRLDQALTKEDG